MSVFDRIFTPTVSWSADLTADTGPQWRRAALTDPAAGLHHLARPEWGEDAPHPSHLYFLDDARLTYRARGLALHLFRLAPGGSGGAEHLAETSPDGRDAVRSGLRELAAAGYLRLERRVPISGRHANGVTVSPEPLPGWSASYPGSVMVYEYPASALAPHATWLPYARKVPDGE